MILPCQVLKETGNKKRGTDVKADKVMEEILKVAGREKCERQTLQKRLKITGEGFSHFPLLVIGNCKLKTLDNRDDRKST